MKKILNCLRNAAAGYEPAVVSSAVAAVFVLAAGLGITVGDLPQKVDAVLTFVAVIAPLIAGARTRAKVTPVKALFDPRGRR